MDRNRHAELVSVPRSVGSDAGGPEPKATEGKRVQDDGGEIVAPVTVIPADQSI